MQNNKAIRAKKTALVIAHIFSEAPTFDKRKGIAELYKSLPDSAKQFITESTHRLIIKEVIIRDKKTAVEFNVDFQLEHNPRSNSLNKQFMIWKNK